jgi:hypothetical protein
MSSEEGMDERGQKGDVKDTVADGGDESEGEDEVAEDAEAEGEESEGEDEEAEHADAEGEDPYAGEYSVSDGEDGEDEHEDEEELEREDYDESDYDDGGGGEYGYGGDGDMYGDSGQRVAAALRCPISDRLMYDPVVLSDGHTYDRPTIEEWLARGGGRSPKTGELLARKQELRPNFLARAAVEALGGPQPAAVTEEEARDAVDWYLDWQAAQQDSGDIGRRNREQRRTRARHEEVNSSDNWVQTVDQASGQPYWYNKLTRASTWERPSRREAKPTVRPVKTEYEGFRGFPGVKPVAKAPRTPRSGLCGMLIWAAAAAVLASGGVAMTYLLWMLDLLPTKPPPAATVVVGASTAMMQIVLMRCGCKTWLAAVAVIGCSVGVFVAMEGDVICAPPCLFP